MVQAIRLGSIRVSRFGKRPSPTPTAQVLSYRREQIGHQLNGFGLVVPRTERRSIASVSISSIKFPGRSPDGTELIRVFLNEANNPNLSKQSDQELLITAERELSELLDIQGPPLDRHQVRWSGVMPQYQVGHENQVLSITNQILQNHRLALAGNSYSGVGIPHCIQRSERAAEQIASAIGCQSDGDASADSIENSVIL